MNQLTKIRIKAHIIADSFPEPLALLRRVVLLAASQGIDSIHRQR